MQGISSVAEQSLASHKELDSIEFILSRIETYWIEGLGTQILRKLLGPEGDQLLTEVRKLHNEKLHNLFSSHRIVKMIKSRDVTYLPQMGRQKMNI
jgi:hypothetical protein